MIDSLIYRCPRCGVYDWLDRMTCRHCDASVDITGVDRMRCCGEDRPIADWYDRIRRMPLPKPEGEWIMSDDGVVLSTEAADRHYAGLDGLTAVAYSRKYRDKGCLRLAPDRLHFTGHDHRAAIGMNDITGVTIESDTVIVMNRSRGALFFDFQNEKGKQWEDAIRRALDDRMAPAAVLEYYPRIRCDRDRRPVREKGEIERLLLPPSATTGLRPSLAVFRMLRALAGAILPCLLPIRLEGASRLPVDGPGILMGNHSSFMDAVLLEALLPRRIWFMTKNSQFSHPLLNALLRIAGSFPVRRYATDVQAVRNAIRVVRQGHVLGLFPEGERCWDGRMLPFRRGAIRLALALGGPIIPVGISGAYALMPRWTRRIRRVPITIRVGHPFRLKPVAIDRQDERDISRAEQCIRRRIEDLMG